MRSFFQFFSQSITLVLGLVFIFGMGLLYAFVRPEELIINLIFFVIVLGWLVFVIKYVWDALDKGKK